MRIVHARVRGRVRIAFDSVRGDARWARAIEDAARALEGVRDARASTASGTVLVFFDPDRVTAARVLAAILDTPALERRVAPRPGREKRTARAAGHRRELLPELARALRTRSLLDEQLDVRELVRAITAMARTAGPPPAPREPVDVPPWHTMHVVEVLARLASTERGLAAGEAEARLLRAGPNELSVERPRSELSILLGQLRSGPVALLAGSAVVSALTGGVADAVVIAIVVVVNAAFGWLTESTAEQTLGELDRSGPRHASVDRAGDIVVIAIERLVPGDVLVLAAGTLIAADARVISADALSVDESLLTGESMTIEKRVQAIAGDRSALADRTCMVYRGTVVTGGAGRAVIVATGDTTEIGRIRRMASEVTSRETPMQRELRVLGSQLVWIAGAVCLGVVGIGWLRGRPLREMLMGAISLAVAAVPEGLPTVAITTLALGIRRMREHGVLIRHLHAVEALGAVQTLCFDKTGTITRNRMVVEQLHAGGRSVQVRDARLEDPDVRALVEALALCNEVAIRRGASGEDELVGSPTEAALVRVALELGLDVVALRSRRPMSRSRPREETRSTMATVHGDECGSGELLLVKGRPSEVLAGCTRWLVGGRDEVLDDDARAALERENERLAGLAYRVLAIAMRRVGDVEDAERENHLVHLGMVAMADPPREGISELMAAFHRAGIETVMITGDQPATAEAIARRIGLSCNGELRVLDSTRVDAMTPEVLREAAPGVQVFARVSPRHKLAIVRALQEHGRVVAMTGDGVNDGPALKIADVGVAMGDGGSEAARDLADVVLLDDRLETMAIAIERGRAIHDDVGKAVRFMLATNLSEILITAVGVASGLGEPLTPKQLLWLNVLTDILPELALAIEPPEPDVLARPPRDPARAMFTNGELVRVAIEGTTIASVALASFTYGRARWGPGARASSLAFASLSTSQLMHALGSRSERHTIFDAGRLPPNRAVPLTIAGSLALQMIAERLPLLRRALGIVPIGPSGWAIALGTGVVALLATEQLKLHWRRDDDRSERASEPGVHGFVRRTFAPAR